MLSQNKIESDEFLAHEKKLNIDSSFIRSENLEKEINKQNEESYDISEEMMNSTLWAGLKTDRSGYFDSGFQQRSKERYLEDFTSKIKYLKSSKEFLPKYIDSDDEEDRFLMIDGTKIYYDEGVISEIVNMDLRRRLAL